jgi:phosphatidylglycerol---prolipoprotein diacylglyceryl transferase
VYASIKHAGQPGLTRNPLYWQRMIPFLHVWRLAIPTFGLMVATAMLAAYYVLRADLARRGIAAAESGLAEAFIAIPCLAGIVGAKLYHVLETPRELFDNPLGEIFSQFGFAWFGGMIAGIAAFVWVARRHGVPLLVALDVGSPAAALGYGIGRIGCFLSGDGDYGILTSLPWGVSFPNGLVPTDVRVHPTPIYELIVACAIAWVLWRMGARAIRSVGVRSVPVVFTGTNLNFPLRADGESQKQSQERGRDAHSPSSGQARATGGGVFAAYLLLTGVARFLVEFIRINPRSFFGMSNAQAASLASVIAGVALWAWIRKQHSA